jgi:hypothetical protein
MVDEPQEATEVEQAEEAEEAEQARDERLPLPPEVRQAASNVPVRQQNQQEDRYASAADSISLSDLLRNLELVRDDDQKFDSTMDSILRVSGRSVPPNERAHSWEKIRHAEWYANISGRQELYLAEIAKIFGLVVVPDLTGPDAPDATIKIALWAFTAPPPMIDGLLAAAQAAGPETWQDVMRILESVLAARWAAQYLGHDRWDAQRVTWAATEMRRGENRKGSWWRHPR